MAHLDAEVRACSRAGVADLGGRGDLDRSRTARPASYSNQPDDAKLAFVSICAHYFGNRAFLEEDQLLRGAGKLAGIPGILVHGRHDLGGPLKTAWDLAMAWPGCELVVVEYSGHTGREAFTGAFWRAFDQIAGPRRPLRDGRRCRTRALR